MKWFIPICHISSSAVLLDLECKLIKKASGSAVELDSVLMELFEVNSVLPSLLDLWNLVGSLLGYILRVYAIWYLHDLKRIWFHEHGECVSTYLCACQLFAPHHTVRGCLEVASWKNLHTFSQLESQHLRWNWNSCTVRKSILCKESSGFQFVCGLLSLLISIDGWSKSSKCSMVIVPPTPIIFCFSLGLKWKIV